MLSTSEPIADGMSYPPNVANAKTINEFKNELDDAWKEKTTNDELHDENADENEDAWANRRDSEFVCDLKYMVIIIIMYLDSNSQRLHHS